MTDKVQLPRLYLAWLTPPHFAPGDAALDMVADALAGGKNSRLYKRLVYDLQIAQDVSAYQASQALSSYFLIRGHRPARPHDRGAPESDRRGDRQAADADAADAHETQRSINTIEASFFKRMEQVGGFGGKADQLNAYFTATGDPDYFNEDLARYRSMSPSDVRAAAAQVPAEGPARRADRAAGRSEVVMRTSRTAASLLSSSLLVALTLPAVVPRRRPIAAKPPQSGPPPTLKLPTIQKRTLSNGLPVWIVERHEVPIVQVNLVVLSGTGDDPAGKFGIASLTASMLTEGAGIALGARDCRRGRLPRRRSRRPTAAATDRRSG